MDAVKARYSKSVFPAHAGMSPTEGLHYNNRGSFPRTRGDEPIAVPDDMVEQLFSPHTRG